MIRRPPRSTPLYSSAASDVYKRQRLRIVLAGVSASGPRPATGRRRLGAQPDRTGRGDPVTGGVSAAAVFAVTEPDPAGFDHVLAGVTLVGPAARLAAMLEVGMLTEAGWDPAARVLSLPAAHPLLGRRLCRVGGCLSTTRGTKTGGVCGRCITRLTGQGLSGQQIASSAELAALTIRPGGCAVAGCQRMSPSPRATLCGSHRRMWRRKPGTCLEQFLADPAVRPLPALQLCLVEACTRRSESGPGYCPTHYQRWRKALAAEPGTDERLWQLTCSAVSQAGM